MRDVTIIGGGPAGSVAAVVLARRKWDVTLFEQGHFPRDKVCGECVSALGIDVLRRIGLADRIAALGPVRLRRTIIVSPDGSRATVELPREMWGLSRVALDAALIDAAREAGAAVYERHRCELVTCRDGTGGGAGRDDDGGVTVRVRDLDCNALRDHAAPHVVIADGKAALGLSRPEPTADFGVKTHYVGVCAPADAVLLLGVRGHYVGVAPIECGRWNVAMSVPEARLRDVRRDLDALLERLMGENRAMAGMFRNARRAGAWLTSPLPRFGVTRDWPGRVIPIGNAAAALEPVGGEGMGLAMRSAELAADALDRAQRNRCAVDVTGLRRQFVHLWRSRRIACRAAAVALSSPAIADAGIGLFAGTRLADASARIMGK